jgi:hypothetical protein
LLLLCGSAKAQFFSDLFGQASKQKKNYIAQLEAYRALAGQIRSGYHIARNGLGSIANYNLGELTGHQAFYGRLHQVDPMLKPDADLILKQQDLIDRTFRSIDDLDGYRDRVLSRLHLDRDRSELQHLLDANFQMTDEERLKKLAALRALTTDKYEFSRHFADEVRLYLIHQYHEDH